MIPLGYLYKKVAKRPDWLKAGAVNDVYSLSSCISEDFTDYIQYWRHNGYWLFDSPEVIEDIAQTEGIDLSETTLFYYEAYEYEFDENAREWVLFARERSFVTDIHVPLNKQLEGYDVTTFMAHTSPECSPLSCNALATAIPVNEHCLIRTFAGAKEALDKGLFQHCEPGPYRIIAVYTLSNGVTHHSKGPA